MQKRDKGIPSGVAKVNRKQVIERLKAGEILRESGNSLMFKDGSCPNGWTEIWLIEKGYIITKDNHYPKKYRWNFNQELPHG